MFIWDGWGQHVCTIIWSCFWNGRGLMSCLQHEMSFRSTFLVHSFSIIWDAILLLIHYLDASLSVHCNNNTHLNTPINKIPFFSFHPANLGPLSHSLLIHYIVNIESGEREHIFRLPPFLHSK
jgi:hypothetical protein